MLIVLTILLGQVKSLIFNLGPNKTMVEFWATVFFGWKTLTAFPKSIFVSTSVFNSSSIWNFFLWSVSFWPQSLLLGRWIRVKSSMAGLRFYQNPSKFPWNSKYFHNGSRKKSSKSNHCKVVPNNEVTNQWGQLLSRSRIWISLPLPYLLSILLVKSYSAHMKLNVISKTFWLIVH